MALKTGLEALSDAFNLSYDSAIKNTGTSVENYNQTSSAIESMNTELETTQARMKELRSQDNLSLTDKTELSKLTAQESSLKRQLIYKQKIADSQAEEKASNATAAMKHGNQSVAQQIAQDVPGGKETYQGDVGIVTVPDAIRENVAAIADYEKSIKSLKSAQKKDDKGSYEWKQKEKEIQSYNSAVKKLYKDLSLKTNDAETLLEGFTVDGEAISGKEDYVNDIQNALTEVDTMNMTSQEKKDKGIEDFFNKTSNASIKNYLTDMANAGKTTTQLSDAINNLGLTSADFGGAALSEVAQHFTDIAKSAKEAASEANKVDGTLSGVGKALETKNAGSDFVTMSGYLDNSKSWFEQGLTGTDEFEAVEKMISGNTGQSYEAAMEKIQTYFTKDDSGNLTKDGIQAFVKEFEALPDTFSTTSDAADKMGLSLSVFEALMGRVSDYDGFEGTEDAFENMTKSSQNIEDAQTALSGLQEIYDSMEEGKEKDKLKISLDKWSGEIEAAEGDLANLPEEKITKLLFEYDKAELEKANDEARESTRGGASSDTKRDAFAGIIANNEEIVEDTKGETGFGISFPLTAEMEDLETKVEEAKEYLASLGEDEKSSVVIDAQIEVDEAQQNFIAAMEELAAAHPDLPATLSIDDTEAINKVAEILGMDPQVIVDFLANSSETDAESTKTNGGSRLVYYTTSTGQVIGFESQAHVVNGQVVYTPDQAAVNNLPVSKADGLTVYAPDTTGLPIAAPSIYGLAYYSPILPVGPVAPNAPAAKSGGGGKGPANGTAHYYGTAHSQGTAMWQHYRNAQGLAYAGGNWGLNRSQNVLMNELGNEIVVRNGRWMTFNDGYPTFANLKAGDIVFNHKQSSELLKNGYVTGSHASLIGGAFANGTASGTAMAKGNGEPETFIDKLSKFFDWCERRLDVLTKFTDRIFKSMERIAHLPFKQDEMYRALSGNRDNIEANRQSYGRYMSHANWIAASGGLSGDIQQKVQQGTIDITEYDDDTKKLIKSYEEYYDKAQDCADEIDDLIDKQAKYVKKALDNVEDYYEMMGAKDIANQKRIKSQMEYLDAIGESNTSGKIIDFLKESKNNEAVTLDLAQGKYNTYKNEIDKLLASGYMAMYDKEWFAAQTKLKELEGEIYESKTALEEFNDKLREVEYSKLQYVIDAFSRAIDRIKNINSLTEARGEDVTEGSYQKQINANNASIKDNYNLRTKKSDELALYDVNSDKYKELAKDIADIDDDIYGLLESNEKLKDSIREVRWKPFYDGTDALDDLIGETDDLRSLLNDAAFLDKNGLLTAEGAANIALISQGMNAAKQMVADYTAGLKKLDEELKNGNVSQNEYDESQKDFLDTIRDSVDTVEDYKNELLDLNKEQLEAEADALQTSIDKRKEALRAKKEYYDYDKNVRGQTKDINAIKAQMAALEGVTNASAQAEYKRLQAELSEKQDDLSETKKDHADDMQLNGYDKMADDVDKALEDTLYEITHNADKQQEVIANMLNQVVGMYGDAYGKINQIINNTGFIQGSDGKQNTDNLGSESGAKDQTTNSQTPQGNVKPSDSAGNINTGPINNNSTNADIEQEIGKEVDTSNRLIAELKISNTALSLQAGTSKALSISVRPTDAANKTMYWVSSMPEIASVSGGTVKALRTGSAMIICSTTDGSGLSATCSVTVTSPPPPPVPPAPPAPPVLPHGGIPFIPKQDFYPKNQLNIGTSVVDRLKYHNFDSSMGACSQLYSYWGGSGGYSGSAAQNTWLLSKMAQAGYAGGTTHSIGGIARINELGEELIVRQHGNDYTYLTKGSGVVPADLTENLMKWGAINPGQSLTGNVPSKEPKTEVYNHYDALITVEGNVDKDALPSLKTIVKEAYKYTSKEFVKEAKKKL